MAIMFQLLISEGTVVVLTVAIYVLIHSTSCHDMSHQVMGQRQHSHCTVCMHEGGVFYNFGSRG